MLYLNMSLQKKGKKKKYHKKVILDHSYEGIYLKIELIFKGFLKKKSVEL
jgi:hypothetical protein